jgi:hypothetical protein
LAQHDNSAVFRDGDSKNMPGTIDWRRHEYRTPSGAGGERCLWV